VAAAALAVAALPLLPGTAGAASPSFLSGVLPPPPAGSTTAVNQAAEPAIRSDPAGGFYISSENGIAAGTEAWKSTDGGRTYVALPQPNAVSTVSEATGIAPGGGDTDLATATRLNAARSYNTYVSSLTLGDVTVSVSGDGGKTWKSNVLTATIPVDDREWIAASGASTYFLSYHDLAGNGQIIVNEGTVKNGLPVSVLSYSAITDPRLLLPATIGGQPINGNQHGNIAVDQTTGNVYQVFAACPVGLLSAVTCQDPNAVYMAVGTPTGRSLGGLPVLRFTDHVIHTAPAGTSLANNFPNVAVDRAGNVYAAWSDGRAVGVAYSRDRGATWSTPAVVNSGAAQTAIFPWLTAQSPGNVDLVYYGTPDSQNRQTCATSAAADPCQTQPWRVFMAQNLSMLSGGAWRQYQVTPVVHYGGVCQEGVLCLGNGNDNRDLFDDFGVSVSPTSGLASIAYSDDQYGELAGSSNAALCTAAQTNSAACDHTDYATQTSGSGI
jgi:hypothetical protein